MCRWLFTPPACQPPRLVFTMTANEAVLDRLADQLAWYDRKAATAQFWHQRLKLLALVAASLVPVFAILDGSLWLRGVTALLGVIVAVCEGVQQLNQYQRNWISYRATAEALKHEMYLFTARIGPYAGPGDDERHAALLQTVETLIAAEHSKWIAQRNSEGAGKGEGKDAKTGDAKA